MRKRKMLTIHETAQFLLAHDRYVILTHRRPDGDAAGSAAALCRGLRALGKTAAVLDNPQFTKKLRPYVAGLTCESAQPDSTVITTDIASEGLLSFGAEALAPRIELVIDTTAAIRFPVKTASCLPTAQPAARSSMRCCWSLARRSARRRRRRSMSPFPPTPAASNIPTSPAIRSAWRRS